MGIWIVIVASFLIAALSGMGVGSGGLLVVFLTLFADVPQISAQGVNLVFFLFSSGASMLYHVGRRQLPLLAIVLVSAAGLLGAIPGTYAALLLPEKLVRRLFSGMLVLSGTVSLFKRKKDTEKNKNIS